MTTTTRAAPATDGGLGELLATYDAWTRGMVDADELAHAIPQLVRELKATRRVALELLEEYRRSELDGIANFPLSPDEEQLLAADVARYRRGLDGGS